ncbi:hypothetical protein ETAA8_17310 [Anatilimnocola aggregata]|uniref:Uncharacterized protein n=1 Tax=Anatilimnocola aggregata TaxID=2528021 RepID=A0A517Y8U0_9BACT|nr:hypothetical protein ETAA8_17310 [Anatilimnocola aggregata]
MCLGQDANRFKCSRKVRADDNDEKVIAHALLPVARQAPWLVSFARRTPISVETIDLPSETALEICAALCRFTV